MVNFPKLKTSAVAQYPANRVLSFRNQTLRFLDGTEQRYRDSAGPLHRWEIRLNQLDEGEMSALETFFEMSEGRFGAFTFTDPWDGTVYPSCSLASDGLDLITSEEMNGATSLTVVENRG
ncbi:MAG TPA: DUF2460 domain-containing protein [Bryobacteraceae bacterium]|nr:DUF2460 domain-containing protein [Bryobacteraceae bacterium]